jgi:hypothetical protein
VPHTEAVVAATEADRVTGYCITEAVVAAHDAHPVTWCCIQALRIISLSTIQSSGPADL